MALVLADRVRETTTVTGTGTATLLGAVSGYQSFAAVGNANTTYYVIANQSASEWEVGIGTYTASGTTLSRDTVLSSSNSGSLVNFSAGTKDVFVDYPAGRAVYEDAAGNVDGYPITGGTIDNTVIGGTTPAAGTFTTLTATGQTSLGGAAGSEGLRVLKTTSSVNFLQGSGAVTGSNPVLTGQGGDAEVGLDFAIRTGGLNYVRQRIASSGNIDFSLNAAGSQAMRTTIASSQVNYVQVTGAATGARPTISAQGSDAAVDLNFAAKGIGGIYFQSFSVFGSGKFNNWTTDGAVTGLSPFLRAGGGDTNVSATFQSKGTGAINLAPGANGVNISNGGTVTAITRTAAGSGYTTIPSVAVSAPTTAGGVQAVVTVAQMQIAGATIHSGGTGYTVGNTLTIVGGTPVTSAATLTVTTVSAGVITGVSVGAFTNYTVLPTNPVSVTGGTGSGATFNITYAVISFTITNAGSGYVEQPTVTFSGGGGSGAAAYATVGSGTVVRSLNNTFDFYLPSGLPATSPAFRISDGGGSGTYINAITGPTGAYPAFFASGGTNVSFAQYTAGTGSFLFNTASGGANQMRITHTASAVNYVQVTGAATGNGVTVSSQGSDANIGLNLTTKGTFGGTFRNSAGSIVFSWDHSNSSTENYIGVASNISTGVPIVSARGAGTNIDLALTPKGTGNVRFGTYTANMALTIQGYIEIKDSGGTVRKLAVIA
jgi:hypothetical protein